MSADADRAVTYPPECRHPQTTTVRVMLRNGSEQIREICDSCFANLKVLRKADVSHRLHELPSVTRDELVEKQSRYEEAHGQQYVAAWRARKEKERQEWLAGYNEYLASAEWKALRRKVIQRSGGICEGCLERPVDCVHHLTYNNLGHELCFQLVGLCHDCHRRVHEDKQEVAA